VLLIVLGGGVFGNAPEWIHTAIERAVNKAQGFDLDVRLVRYGPPSEELRKLVNTVPAGPRIGVAKGKFEAPDNIDGKNREVDQNL
jgi:hypothetical protein